MWYLQFNDTFVYPKCTLSLSSLKRMLCIPIYALLIVLSIEELRALHPDKECLPYLQCSLLMSQFNRIRLETSLGLLCLKISFL